MGAHNLGALAEPAIAGPMPVKHGSFLILASDGVWDKLPGDFVSANVGMARAESSAHAMAFAARARWPPEGDIDDITAVVVQVFPGTKTYGENGTLPDTSEPESKWDV